MRVELRKTTAATTTGGRRRRLRDRDYLQYGIREIEVTEVEHGVMGRLSKVYVYEWRRPRTLVTRSLGAWEPWKAVSHLGSESTYTGPRTKVVKNYV